jgi:hypothetical protein
MKTLDDLTEDESASIMLYTMKWEPQAECLQTVINATIHSKDKQKLKPWLSYLKLILNALSRLPSHRRLVYRGVKMDVTERYPLGETVTWWSFSACTSNIGSLGQNEKLFGKTTTRTLFFIDCDSGKDISQHSYYESDDEVLLPVARQFKVIDLAQLTPDLHIIQLREIQPPLSLLHSLK